MLTDTTAIAPDFRRAATREAFSPARLVPTTTSGYLLVAGEVDRRPMFLPPSRRKRQLVARLRRDLDALRSDGRVIEANLFTGLLTPPGRGEVLRGRTDLPPARFDVALLVETSDQEAARAVEQDPAFRALSDRIGAESRRTYRLRATNVRSMGPVDHLRQGVFLLNYFYAERTDLNLAAWQYTAGWFMDQTGLDNSTVLLPEQTNEPEYRLVNHARWDRLRDVLPALLFRRSFHTYVLEHFRLNGVAAQPILYRIVP